MFIDKAIAGLALLQIELELGSFIKKSGNRQNSELLLTELKERLKAGKLRRGGDGVDKIFFTAYDGVSSASDEDIFVRIANSNSAEKR